MKKYHIVLLMMAMGFVVSSCSWVSGHREEISDDEYQNKKVKALQTVPDTVPQTVPKSQYDQLLEKYEALLKESSQSGSGVNLEAGLEKDKILDALNTAPRNESHYVPELAETVDIFGLSSGLSSDTDEIQNVQNVQGTQGIQGTQVAIDYSKVDVEGQLTILDRAQKLLSENKIDEAMGEIKKIENSKVRQVAVRAKYLLGESLVIQNEYDMAMQVFKEIVKKDAFSGVVYKTLGKLILCTEKLQLEDEKELYYSMFQQIWGS